MKRTPPSSQQHQAAQHPNRSTTTMASSMFLQSLPQVRPATGNPSVLENTQHVYEIRPDGHLSLVQAAGRGKVQTPSLAAQFMQQNQHLTHAIPTHSTPNQSQNPLRPNDIHNHVTPPPVINRRPSTQSLTDLMVIHNQLLLDTQERIKNLNFQPQPSFQPDIHKLCQSIPKTDGSNPETFMEFLIQLDKITNLNLIQLHILLKGLCTYTEGELQLWLSRYAGSNTDWNTVKTRLINTFLSPMQISRLQLTKIFRFQYPEENFKQYIQTLQTAAQALNIGDELRIVTHICDCASAKYLPFLSNVWPTPTTFQQLYTIAARMDEAAQRIESAVKRENQSSNQKN